MDETMQVEDLLARVGGRGRGTSSLAREFVALHAELWDVVTGSLRMDRKPPNKMTRARIKRLVLDVLAAADALQISPKTIKRGEENFFSALDRVLHGGPTLEPLEWIPWEALQVSNRAAVRDETEAICTETGATGPARSLVAVFVALELIRKRLTAGDTDLMTAARQSLAAGLNISPQAKDLRRQPLDLSEALRQTEASLLALQDGPGVAGEAYLVLAPATSPRPPEPSGEALMAGALRLEARGVLEEAKKLWKEWPVGG